jgi:serine/threonine protein kinase
MRGVARSELSWKIADFGIATVGTSKNLIVTQERRGTAHYSAPEILLAEASIPSYTNKVDIWGLGMILYELWTGKRPFQTSYHVMQYFWHQLDSPKVLWPRPMPSAIGWLGDSETVPHQCSTLWATMKTLFPSSPEIIPSPPYPGTTTENIEIALKGLIALLLHRDSTKRPSIRQVGQLIAANRLATVMLFPVDEAWTLGMRPFEKMLGGPTNKESPQHWAFLIELEVAVPLSTHIH